MPMVLKVWSRAESNPFKNQPINITNMMPITTPSVVRKERILFELSASKDIRDVSVNSLIFIGLKKYVSRKLMSRKSVSPF